MILSNILYRTYFIKAEQYGTAFALDVDGVEYVVTARHLLDASKNGFLLKLFLKEQWHDLPAIVVGHGRGEIDISVLKIPIALAGPTVPVNPTVAELILGQDMYFLGFPYKMWSDGCGIMGGRPIAFAKKGTASSIGFGDPQVIHVDAINNEGFSGGPLFFYPAGKPTEVRVAGVVSKYRIENEIVVDGKGNRTDMSVPYNTGFLIAYGIKHAIDIIKRSVST
ncbi:MAG: serine protease [Desulfobacula sp.]|nr:serine protease [Desulfobacula sp.]NJM01050.1 trypsin-like peptidase domain-containing protein [Desulfobacula sp.]